MHSGQYVQVQCLISDGDLPISFSWDLNGRELDEFPEIVASKMGKRSSILSIESVSYTNTGNYTCTARNAAGIARHTAQLLING